MSLARHGRRGFHRPVQLDQGALTLALHTQNVRYGGVPEPGGMGTIPSTINVTPSADNATWTMTFAGEGTIESVSSLKDGVYDLIVDGTKIHAADGTGLTMSGTFALTWSV